MSDVKPCPICDASMIKHCPNEKAALKYCGKSMMDELSRLRAELAAEKMTNGGAHREYVRCQRRYEIQRLELEEARSDLATIRASNAAPMGNDDAQDTERPRVRHGKVLEPYTVDMDDIYAADPRGGRYMISQSEWLTLPFASNAAPPQTEDNRFPPVVRCQFCEQGGFTLAGLRAHLLGPGYRCQEFDTIAAPPQPCSYPQYCGREVCNCPRDAAPPNVEPSAAESERPKIDLWQDLGIDPGTVARMLELARETLWSTNDASAQLAALVIETFGEKK